MAFKDLGDWSKLGGLELPISGKVYRLPPVNAELGPRLQTIVSFGLDVASRVRGMVDVSEKDRTVLDDMAERELFREILHPCESDPDACQRTEDARCPLDVYTDMQDDKVPWAALKHAAMTSMMDAVFDRAVAEQYWAAGGKPQARKTGSKGRSGTASKTTRASTAGTTSRKPKKAGTPGQKSSNTGP